MGHLFFYFTGAALLILAALTVLSRNLFRAVLSFLGVILCTAVLFVALGAEVAALAQVMVYIGGILIFVLYAVFLTSELGGRMPAASRRSTFIAAAALLATGAVLGIVWRRRVPWSGEPGAEPHIASLKAMGLRILNAGPDGFLIPFELISVLLLAAMVGAIAVAKRDGRGGAS